MKFEQVLPALREGKKIRRKEWSESGLGMLNSENMPRLYISHILSDDWEVVEEHKPCPGCSSEGRVKCIKDEYSEEVEFIIECAGPRPCFATYPPQVTKSQAWEIWDKRV